MTTKSKAQKKTAAPDSTRRKIESLLEVPAVCEFLTANGLEMTGMKRAGRKYTNATGYDQFEFVVKFDVGEKAWTDAPEDMFSDGSVGKDALIAALAGVEFPKEEACKSRSPGDTAPKKLQNLLLDPRAWHDIDLSQDELTIPIYDQNGDCAMIEQRFIDGETQRKICVRWTHYADFKWRDDDPEQLPLWGMHLLDGNDTVYLHEGPKAAIAAMRMHRIDDLPSGGSSSFEFIKRLRAHPWFDEFSKYPSLGWIGGTGRVERIDLGALKRMGVQKVYVVPDNDAGGRSAAHEIAKRLYGVDVEIMNPYGDEFGLGWDLADPVPDGASFPGWSDYTRMTTVAGTGRNGPVYKLRPSYPKGISFVKEIQRWVPAEAMHLRLTDEELGKFYRNNIDAGARPQFADLIAASGTDYSFEALGFLPRGPKSIPVEGGRALNLWRPSGIEPRPMTDEGRLLFDRYFEHLVPDPLERAFLRRWVASVIVHPERKFFAVALFSEMQGTGKTTLYRDILQPLVGRDYCVEPTVDDLSGRFTDWREGKVLIFGDELQGNSIVKSGDIYNTLKSWITSDTARIEPKGGKRYEIADFAKLLVATNKDKPLHIEPTDRRWLIVHATERRMPREFARDFIGWLRAGGTSEVLWWAQNYEAEGVEPAIPDELFGELDRENLKTGSAPIYLPEQCEAPFTNSKIDLREKSVPRDYRVLGEILRTMDGSTDGEGRMLAVSSRVLFEAYLSVASDLKLPPRIFQNERDLVKRCAAFGYYVCDVAPKNSKTSDLPPPWKHRMRNDAGDVSRPSATIILNRKAFEFAVERGAIDVLSREHLTYEPVSHSWDKLVRLIAGQGALQQNVLFAKFDASQGRFIVRPSQSEEDHENAVDQMAENLGIELVKGGKSEE